MDFIKVGSACPKTKVADVIFMLKIYAHVLMILIIKMLNF